MYHTSTVQYRFATYRCSQLPSGGGRWSSNRAFAGVKARWENFVASIAPLCPTCKAFRDSRLLSARVARASVSRIDNFIGFSNTTVSRFMKTYSQAIIGKVVLCETKQWPKVDVDRLGHKWVGQDNINTLFEMCHTSTGQYRYAMCHCSLLPSGGWSGDISRAFNGVKVVWKKFHFQ